ncbi:hypothetical protein SAMN06264364_10189 [Quadrisphaera granulorum]|uniref:Helicase HerA-like C-terminal domain-containing protein n=1 Tax=Quadrisphaera granulorum TaxID=317664 RepID=A0A316AGQ2_9ACTN|nr:helicase HerA-like domain-containing protein [Quadrisphaera granulorum]PWJ56114.1 hypothetical protein BXY45_10189 [Quadrisphaera granulorum]SZE94748.1 hypothetical protein SAMN06264364_10189 [Quadrisphaera granulorum]
MTSTPTSSADNGAAAFVAEVRKAYAASGAAVQLGALVVDGVAHSDAPVQLPLSVLNRHGLVAGATGTGKTKTLQLIAEQLSAHGVPTFLTDVKGDLSGIALPGQPSDRVASRAADVGQQWAPAGCPTELLALGGLGTGVPVRATITSFGPSLLARVLDLSEVQSSSLALVFHWADKAGLPLLDLADLRAVISHLVSPEGKADLEGLGGLSKQTAGVLLRELLAFADGGADAFFGEPELDVHDLLRTVPADGSDDGERGVVSCLELPAVQGRPALFSTFLLWLLAELFEELPEVGDLDKPKLVFFFDEAHLLFTGASKDFVAQVAQTVRLVRSKGVGVVFVTQSPTDLPKEVLAQLGSRVQHALRAFTPDDAKALRATASTYPRSSHYDTETLLTSVGTGEAVVTVLSENGVPTPVAWTRLRAPQSLMGPAPEAEQQRIVAASPLQAEYGTPIDRDSAYERLTRKTTAPARPSAEREPAPSSSSSTPQRPSGRRTAEPEERSVVEQVLGSSAFRSFARSAASSLGREITRSLFGVRRR